LRFDDTGRALLYIQNVGAIKVKYHRPLPDKVDPARSSRKAGYGVKHMVIKRQGRKWYVCLMLEMPDPATLAAGRPAVGIDLGLYALLALSNGELVDNPRWLRASLEKLRRAQRKLARCQPGSQRRRKAAAQVARLHEQIANQRRDFWHKVTRELVTQFGLIALEDLNLDFMLRNPHLSLSAHDAGLGEFRQLLAYKAEEAGTRVVTVNPAYTSQMCSGCGELVQKSLSVRVHRCPHCSLELDRDVNAARNILSRALPDAQSNLPAPPTARTERSGLNVDGLRALRSSLL
jgi:putative transposase